MAIVESRTAIRPASARMEDAPGPIRSQSRLTEPPETWATPRRWSWPEGSCSLFGMRNRKNLQKPFCVLPGGLSSESRRLVDVDGDGGLRERGVRTHDAARKLVISRRKRNQCGGGRTGVKL